MINETNNLAGQSQYFDQLSRFRLERQNRWDVTKLRNQIIESQKQRHIVAKALNLRTLKSWDHQPFEDASQQYIRNHKEFWELLRLSRYPGITQPSPQKNVYRKTTAFHSGEQ